MYHAAQLNVDVVLHDATNMYIYLLRKDGTVDEYAKDDEKVRRLLFKPSTLYLFNPAEKGVQAKVSSAFTVIATTPDEKHCPDFSKLYGADEQHLSPWTCDEAVDANNALPPDQRLEESTIRERFLQVGGSVRNLFAPTEYYTDNVLSVFKSLPSTGISASKLHDLVEMIIFGDSNGGRIIGNERGSATNLEIAHSLFHCFPKAGPRGYKVGFASEMVRELVVNWLTRDIKSDREWDDFVRFMRRLDSSRASCGLRDEEYIHIYMRHYEKLPKLRVYKGGLDTVLKKTPTYEVSDTPEEAVAKALVDSKCAYIVPFDPEYPAIHSFYVDDQTVYCFQVALTASREFKEEEYAAKTTLIKQLYERKAVMEAAGAKALTFKHCWVVDPQDEIETRPGHYYIHADEIRLSRRRDPLFRV